jgi:Xaa-Pro aminopeptidase
MNRPQRFEVKAAAEGLSVEQWIQKLADSDKPPRENRTGADLIAALQASPYREIDIEPERYRLPVRTSHKAKVTPREPVPKTTGPC